MGDISTNGNFTALYVHQLAKAWRLKLNMQVRTATYRGRVHTKQEERGEGGGAEGAPRCLCIAAPKWSQRGASVCLIPYDLRHRGRDG